MTDHWYALRVKSHKERAVHELLQVRNITAYFPALQVQPKNPRAARIRPYFPGYLFVRTNLDEAGINAFSWLPGTRGLVTFGDIPAIVPDNLIYELRQQIRRIECEGGPAAAADYRQGDKVRIINGPFAGYEAIFDAHLPGVKRVRVLLAFLSSHLQPVKLDATQITKLH